MEGLTVLIIVGAVVAAVWWTFEQIAKGWSGK
jgi:hypothetical protein